MTWSDTFLAALKDNDVRLISYVPDNVLTPLLKGAAADNYLRMAWDTGIETHLLIRGVRREYLAGNNKPFNDSVKRILGAVTTIANGLAELRNRGMGTGHGPATARVGLRTRHAHLAVNAALTWY